MKASASSASCVISHIILNTPSEMLASNVWHRLSGTLLCFLLYVMVRCNEILLAHEAPADERS